MTKHGPLDLGAASGLLAGFFQHFRIVPTGCPAADLPLLARAFSLLPYENLTKILTYAQRPQDLFPMADQVLRDHERFGTGGTCFALTATLLALVRELGLPAEPILADRPYGNDTHSALIVWIDEKPHLLDPGYLITDPIPLAVLERIERATPFNDVLLSRQFDRVALATRQQGKETHRLTFKINPVDAGEFLKAWETSYSFNMMTYPVLTRVDGHRQLYLQGKRLQVRTRDGVQTRILSDAEWGTTITQAFSIDPGVVKETLVELNRQGEVHG